jgi:deoxyribose-phosphate aldolase
VKQAPIDRADPAERERAARAAAWLQEHPSETPAEETATAVRSLARRIDHTLLAPDATAQRVDTLCAEAVEAGFVAVCVSPIHVEQSARRLAGTAVAVATVVGFPSGAHDTRVKVLEARLAIASGASEIDMVLPIGLLRAGELRAVARDVGEVVNVAGGRIVKVILETSLLTEAEKILAVRICREAGASFVKTSTGFGSGGATEADVSLLRHEAGHDLGVKASGGIRTAYAALRMIACGADRLGTSSGTRILEEAARRGN